MLKRKIKKLLKTEVPPFEEWAKQHNIDIGTARPKQKVFFKSIAFRAVLSSLSFIILLVFCLSVFLPKDNTLRYGDNDLSLKTITESELLSVNDKLPKHAILEDKTLQGAFVNKTNQLAYILLGGNYLDERLYFELTITSLLLDNVFIKGLNDFTDLNLSYTTKGNKQWLINILAMMKPFIIITYSINLTM